MTLPFRIKPKLSGVGVVLHRCHQCGKTIEPPDEPVFSHIDGRLVAQHKEHEPWPQTRG
jgi:hypothetical protein